MTNSQQHRLAVQQLLGSKAVDFIAIGKVIGEVGPVSLFRISME